MNRCPNALQIEEKEWYSCSEPRISLIVNSLGSVSQKFIDSPDALTDTEKNTSKGLRQYVANKPNKWGYKLWKLVAGNGYLVNFDVYKGKGSLNKNEKMGETVVKQLINDKFFNKGYCLFTDNFLKSVRNSIYLKFLKIDTVGVIRESKKNLEDFLFEKKLEIYQFEWAVHVNYDILILRICDTKEFVMVQTIKDPTTRGEDYKSNSMGRMNSESIKHSSFTKIITIINYPREFRISIFEGLNGHQTLRKNTPVSTFSNFSNFKKNFQRKDNEKN
ncbi:hypothetical protein ACTFIY_004992 [Dictyostelium cf. discoideum]